MAPIIAVKMVRTEIRQQRNPTIASSLAGSASLHLPPDQEMEFEALTRDLQTNCQILFTMPGMGQFNFWSGVPTPDGFNTDAWMKGVPLEQQQHTLQILQTNPSACVIYRPLMVAVWVFRREASIPFRSRITYFTTCPRCLQEGDMRFASVLTAVRLGLNDRRRELLSMKSFIDVVLALQL